MSEPTADSAPSGQEQAAAPADSAAGGQEQVDQSDKRINGLMSLAAKRTAERDAALAEIADLKAMLEEQGRVETPASQSQYDLMYGSEPEPPPTEGAPDEDDDGGPIVMNTSPVNARYAMRSQAEPVPMTVTDRYVAEQREIAQMKQRLNDIAPRPAYD